jgi:succinate dehydrogenase / fumarate reductase iron-sulfur subunit
MGEEKAKITVFRYNPEAGIKPKYETYEVPYYSGMTVLDVLLYIREEYDTGLAFA